jgi:hypothetical protein
MEKPPQYIIESKLIIDVQGPESETKQFVDNILRAIRLFRMRHFENPEVKVNYRLTEK